MVDCIIISRKQDVKVAGCFRSSGNLSTRNYCQPILFCLLLRESHRHIKISLYSPLICRCTDNTPVYSLCTLLHISFHKFHHISLKATILDMLGNCKHIKTIVPCLNHTKLWRNMSIRIKGMDMKIRLVDIVAVDLRKHYIDP